MTDIEKLGFFYLGKTVNPKDGKTTEEPLLYPSKNLTTHAVCIGMTGSGKTGLGIDLIEEAAIDGIPSIVIDPKGDMGNLLLAFLQLRPDDFLPWIEPAEAAQRGMEPEAYAEKVAKTWKDGLQQWGQSPDRIAHYKNSVEMAVYTPASRSGTPISIVNSFAAPPKDFIEDTQAMREKILSTTSSLLSLIGIDADPVKSREHILISTIIENAWKEGRNLDIASLITEIQNPPFEKIGVLDLDTFFPKKDRQALAVSLNNLLASPGFHAWMEGEPLNVQNLLYTQTGKPKLSVIAIAHLTDSERMFFITLLLNEIILWMRRQPGTSSLRCLLYMDEIFGFFPPSAQPPSKTAMLTLLKQARAFGLGIVLATQNPVDLDYKGLANCGTWFVGKLQTDRDRSRVLEALSASAKDNEERNRYNALLAQTGNRVFLLHSVYENEPILFQTRWTLSYLKGPLTTAQISQLSKDKIWKPSEQTTTTAPQTSAVEKPSIPTDLPEYFIRPPAAGRTFTYKPMIAGVGKVHFLDSKNSIDVWRSIYLVASVSPDGKSILWDKGENVPELEQHLDTTPPQNVKFEEVPALLLQEKNYKDFQKNLELSLYQNQVYEIFKAPSLKLSSNPDESEADFRTRASLQSREGRDNVIGKLREKYQSKFDAIQSKIRQTEEKVEKDRQQASSKKTEAYLSIGATLLGTLFGKGVTKGTINQAGSSIRKATSMGGKEQQIQNSEEMLQSYRQQSAALEAQLNEEIAQATAGATPQDLTITTLTIHPRKSDITIEKLVLIWRPVT